MSKLIATIIGRDFVKEVEVNGSTNMVILQTRLANKYPDCHIEYNKDGIDTYDFYDYRDLIEEGIFTESDLEVAE